jgi:hypothetical protein
MTDDDFDDDLPAINEQSPATDRLARLLRWLGLIGAMGLFGLAILVANR